MEERHKNKRLGKGNSIKREGNSESVGQRRKLLCKKGESSSQCIWERDGSGEKRRSYKKDVRDPQ